MRKPFIAIGLLAVIVFALGYVVGQVRGPSLSSAASSGTNPGSYTLVPYGANGGSNTFVPFGRMYAHGNGGWWANRAAGHAAGAGQAIGKHADGTVTAINDNSVTVQADNDSGNPNEYSSVTTVLLTSSTQYSTGGCRGTTSGTTATKSSIKVGFRIMAEGTVSSDGKTLTASRVSVMSAGAGAQSRTNAPAGFAPKFGGNGPTA